MDIKQLKVLLVEDDPGDADYIEEILSETNGGPAQLIRVTRLAEALAKLNEGDVDVVLLDLSLPDSVGLETFAAVRSHNARIPVLVLTGLDDSEAAVKAVSEGAQDYLVKGHLDGRLLTRAIRYAVERQKTLLTLQDALAEIKKLKALLPICSHCKKIRDDEGYWQAVDYYISEHSETQFSHTLCPDCMKALYPPELIEGLV